MVNCFAKYDWINTHIMYIRYNWSYNRYLLKQTMLLTYTEYIWKIFDVRPSYHLSYSIFISSNVNLNRLTNKLTDIFVYKFLYLFRIAESKDISRI